MNSSAVVMCPSIGKNSWSFWHVSCTVKDIISVKLNSKQIAFLYHNPRAIMNDGERHPFSSIALYIFL